MIVVPLAAGAAPVTPVGVGVSTPVLPRPDAEFAFDDISDAARPVRPRRSAHPTDGTDPVPPLARFDASNEHTAWGHRTELAA